MNVVERFIRWCPGAIGYVLRQKYYKKKLGFCGEKVIFGRFISFNSPENIYIEDNAILSNFVTMIAQNGVYGKKQVVIEKNVFIGTFSTLKALKGGRIVLRKGANISSTCVLHSDCFLEIGRDTLLAAYCSVGVVAGDNNQHSISNQSGTRIGSGCWLGSRVVQDAGTEIGDGTIVGAHAHVASDIAELSIAIGQPAQQLRSRKP